MDKKITFVLAVVFVLLLGIATEPYWSQLLRQKGWLNSTQMTDLGIPNEISQITFSIQDNEPVVLTSGADGWQVAGHKVDDVQLTELLEDINSLTIDSLVSSNPDNFDTYEASDSSPTVVLENNLGERQELILGTNASQIGTIYLRPTDEDKVYLVETNLRNQVTKTSDDWRDKTIAFFTEDEIDSIVITRQTETVTIRQNDQAQWMAEKNGEERIVGEVAKTRLFDVLDPFVGRSVANPDKVELFNQNRNPIQVQLNPKEADPVIISIVEDTNDSIWLASSDQIKDVFTLAASDVNAIVDSTLTLFD